MVTREELHFRRIDMRGYRRSDGRYEIEGRVIDRKPHDFASASGGRALQSLSAIRRGRPERLDATGRPKKIDSCYAYAAHRQLVLRHWPQAYRPAAPEELE